MKAVLALLLFLSVALAERVFPMRNPTSDQKLEMSIKDWRRISYRSAYSVLPKQNVENLNSELPSSIYLEFALDDYIDQRERNLPSIYAAYLQVDVISSSARFNVKVHRTRFAELSHATWDCARDSNVTDSVSICSRDYEGIMTADDNDEGVTVRKNFVGAIRIPATNLGRVNPDKLLLSVTSNSADWLDTLVINASSAKFVFDFPKAHVVTAYGDWHPEASFKSKEIVFAGKKTKFTYYLWEATDPFPGDTCNVVVFVGVPQTIHLGFGQGEIAHEHCNIYMIEQYCTGYNTCPHGGSKAETVFRAAITTDLLWFNEDGFRFPERSVYTIGNDQGGFLAVSVEGYLSLQDEFFFGRHTEFDIFPSYKPKNLVRTGNLWATLLGGTNYYEAGWDGLKYANPTKRASGQGARGFIPYGLLKNPFVSPFLQPFFHFAGCSQLGFANETNPAKSCRAAMHYGNGENAYWLGTRTQSQWEATGAYANLTRDFSFYLNRADINPSNVVTMPHFGFEIFFPVQPAGPEEYAFHSRWTSQGDGNDLFRKQVWANYPAGLPIENSTAGDPMDQWSVFTVDVNKDAGFGPTPLTENVAQTFVIYASAAGAAQIANKNNPNAPVSRFYITRSVTDQHCQGDFITINGQCTTPNGCVCGHGLIGSQGNLDPISGNPDDRVIDLNSIDASPLMPHSCGHQSMRSCDVFVTMVKQIERDHARHYLQ